MGASTGIQWTDATWNPTRGCTVVGPECLKCYAMRFAPRVKAYKGLTRNTKAGPVWTGEVRFAEDMLNDPLSWRDPKMVFVDSMSDLLHRGVSSGQIAQVFDVIARTSRHTYQILTKRAERWAEFYHEVQTGKVGRVRPDPLEPDKTVWVDSLGQFRPWPLRNVWPGVSVGLNAALGRIDALGKVPATVRMVSIEPLLERLNRDVLAEKLAKNRIGWVVCGGESGWDARPCALEWLEDVVEVCRQVDVPVFVKQLGAKVVSEDRVCDKVEDWQTLGLTSRWAWRAGLVDAKGGDPAEWPKELRVREWPKEVRHAA